MNQNDNELKVLNGLLEQVQSKKELFIVDWRKFVEQEKSLVSLIKLLEATETPMVTVTPEEPITEQDRRVTAAIKNGEPLLLDPIVIKENTSRLEPFVIPPKCNYKKKSTFVPAPIEKKDQYVVSKFKNRTRRVREMTKLVVEVIRTSKNGLASKGAYAEFKTYFEEGKAPAYHNFSNWLHIAGLEKWVYRDEAQLYKLTPALRAEEEKK